MTTLAMTQAPPRPSRRAGPSGQRRQGPTRRPSQGLVLCLAMLRQALLWSHLGLVAAVLIGLLRDGPPGGASAAVAAALVIVFFATGQAVQLMAVEQADGTGLALVLGSFALRAVVLALVLWAASLHQQRLEQVLRRGDFLTGALMATVGWLGGTILAHSRARIFVYDADHDAWRNRGGVA